MKKFIFSLFFIISMSSNALSPEQRETVLRLLTPELAQKKFKEICLNYVVPGFEQYFYKLSYSEKNKGCDCYTKGILNEFNWNEVKLMVVGEHSMIWNRQNRVDKTFHSCFPIPYGI
ncbi:hypothetical protein BKG93_10855 [Rodentibacter ratti]|uniref:Uncharacterized protein n=2 Tax=Rodentibacter TaxID=1960084 RepID=A0A1V3KYY5_9PAST|nr:MULTISPECIES: hypothetical protein [Rodentibacter]OOF48906.1 hypothetical protein BKK52_04895 [Rodentibacter trehalosifermentans]OOF82879.1 hypothetical protein BKG93_10855 [Rodentibacter ratti]